MQSDLYFDCDNCDGKFTIGFGFLGSQKDLFKYINKEKSEFDNNSECHPQMQLLSLCEVCINKIK